MDVGPQPHYGFGDQLIASAALVGHKNSAQFQIARHLLSCRVSSGEDPLSIIESSKGRL